jgi:hypothetical protein
VLGSVGVSLGLAPVVGLTTELIVGSAPPVRGRDAAQLGHRRRRGALAALTLTTLRDRPAATTEATAEEMAVGSLVGRSVLTGYRLQVAQEMYRSGQCTVAASAKPLGVSRAFVYRHLTGDSC